MRNLKKVLSLSLALVMLLGMMVVGAGAAEYTDAGEIEYKEAADVLTAIGVMQGREDNSFDPKAELDRAEGAAIIYRMLTGGMTQNPSAASTGFVDVDGVANYSWASGIIADLANKGIVAGEDATHFNPSGKLNGYAFGKMLLVALGYNASSQGYVGGGWEGNVIRDAYNRGITVTGVVMSNSITREQAAQMSLNTLQATMVYQKGGIQVGDVVIPGDRAQDIENTGSDYQDRDIGSAAGEDNKMQFCEAYFSGLKLTTGDDTTDDFGRPVNVWTYNDEEVATAAAKEANYTYTSKPSKKTDLPAALRASGAFDANSVLVINGDDQDPTTATLDNLWDSQLGNGKQVEVYMTGKKVAKVVVTDTVAVTVTSVNTRNNSFRLSNGKTIDEDSDFASLIDQVEKDDVLACVTKADGTIIDLYVPETVTGTLTFIKSDDKQATIGGETVKSYNASALFDDDTLVSAEVAAYMVNGYAIYVEKVEGGSTATDDYIFVTNMWNESVTSYGDTTTKYYALGVLADGTTAKLEIINGNAAEAESTTVADNNKVDDNGDKFATTLVYGTDSGDAVMKSTFTTAAKPQIYKYTESAEVADLYVLTVPTAGNGTTAGVVQVTGAGSAISATANRIGSNFVSKDVVMYYVTGNGDKLTVTDTGRVAIAQSANFGYIVNSDKVISAIFVNSDTIPGEDTIFVVANEGTASYTDANGKVVRGVQFSYYDNETSELQHAVATNTSSAVDGLVKKFTTMSAVGSGYTLGAATNTANTSQTLNSIYGGGIVYNSSSEADISEAEVIDLRSGGTANSPEALADLAEDYTVTISLVKDANDKASVVYVVSATSGDKSGNLTYTVGTSTTVNTVTESKTIWVDSGTKLTFKAANVASGATAKINTGSSYADFAEDGTVVDNITTAKTIKFKVIAEDTTESAEITLTVKVNPTLTHYQVDGGAKTEVPSSWSPVDVVVALGSNSSATKVVTLTFTGNADDKITVAPTDATQAVSAALSTTSDANDTLTITAKSNAAITTPVTVTLTVNGTDYTFSVTATHD